MTDEELARIERFRAMHDRAKICAEELGKNCPEVRLIVLFDREVGKIVIRVWYDNPRTDPLTDYLVAVPKAASLLLNFTDYLQGIIGDEIEDSDRLRHIRDEAYRAGRKEMRAEAVAIVASARELLHGAMGGPSQAWRDLGELSYDIAALPDMPPKENAP